MTGGLKRKALDCGDEEDLEGESSAYETEGDTSCSEVDRKDKGGPDTNHVCPFEGCKAVFKKVGKLNRHVLTHTGERPFACTYPGCDKRFTRVQHLKRHGVVHTGERPFVCTHPGCNHSFTVSSHLTRHMITHETKKPYACTHEGCNESFAKHNQLQRHMCVHTNKLPYLCSYEGCDQSFDFPSLLKRHINRHHLGVAEKQYLCGEPGCGLVFDKHSLLNTHMKEKHPSELKHACTECDKKFKRKKDLETHMGSHFPEDRKLFYCKEPGCQRSYISESNLRTHVRSAHSTDKSFVCTFRLSNSTSASTPTTTTTTTTDSTLPSQTETITNTDNNDNNTEICGKTFAHKHALERHMKTHTKPPKESPPKKKIKPSDSSIVAKLIGSVHYPPLPPPTQPQQQQQPSTPLQTTPTTPPSPISEITVPHTVPTEVC